MTKINYLERQVFLKHLSFFITLSNFLTPKRVLKLYNYKEKIENMRAVLCIYFKISPIPINK